MTLNCMANDISVKQMLKCLQNIMHFSIQLKTNCKCNENQWLIHQNEHHFQSYQVLRDQWLAISGGDDSDGYQSVATGLLDPIYSTDSGHTCDETLSPMAASNDRSLIDTMKAKMTALTGGQPVTTVRPNVCQILTALRVPITCQDCDREYNNTDEFMAHLSLTNLVAKCPKKSKRLTKRWDNNHKYNKSGVKANDENNKLLEANPYDSSDNDETIPMYPVVKGYRCGHTGCTYTATYRRFIKMHYIVHQMDRPFRCGINECQQSFAAKHLLDSHQQTDHRPAVSSKRWIVCHRQDCRYRTKSHANWVAHNVTSHKSAVSIDKTTSLYTCDVCNKCYRRLEVLDAHKQLVHQSDVTGSDDPYKCEHCHNSYKSLTSLNTHVRRCHAFPYVCGHDDCDSRFESQTLLDNHCLRLHLSGITDQSTDQQVAKDPHLKTTNESMATRQDIPIFASPVGFMCGHPSCNYTSRYRRNVMTHFKSHSNDRPFKCRLEKCQMGFKTESVLSSHQIVVHPESFPNRQWLQCIQNGCKYRTKSNNNFNKHRNSHLVRFQCNQCGKSYCERKYLVKHQRAAHTSAILYGCDQCDRQYGLQSALRAHIRRTHQKAYRCDADSCGQMFGLKGDLAKHVRRLHDDSYVRPVACTWPNCMLRFETSLRMSEHLRRHSGQKPIKCTQCDKTFATGGDRAAHVLNQHRVRRFGCEWPGCQFKAAFQSQMRTHTKRHECKAGPKSD